MILIGKLTAAAEAVSREWHSRAYGIQRYGILAARKASRMSVPIKNTPLRSQNPVTWHVTIRKLHKWISEPGEKASRPFVLMITNPEQKSVIKTKIISETPDPQSVLHWINQAVNSQDTHQSPRPLPECNHLRRSGPGRAAAAAALGPANSL